MNILNKYIEESKYQQLLPFMTEAFNASNDLLDIILKVIDNSDNYTSREKGEVTELTYDIIMHGLYYKQLMKDGTLESLPMKRFLKSLVGKT